MNSDGDASSFLNRKLFFFGFVNKTCFLEFILKIRVFLFKLIFVIKNIKNKEIIENMFGFQLFFYFE